MYKDKEKQREANRKASKTYREGMTRKGEGMTDKVLYFDNGSYIHIEKLIDPKWGSLLAYLCKNMRYPDNIRVGIQGPTIRECKKLLEVTG